MLRPGLGAHPQESRAASKRSLSLTAEHLSEKRDYSLCFLLESSKRLPSIDLQPGLLLKIHRRGEKHHHLV